MKHYNINCYNGWRFYLELLAFVLFYAIIIFLEILFLMYFWLLFIAPLILLIYALVRQCISGFSSLINCFYFDEKNSDIILKLTGREKVRIPISSIGRIYPKVNENPKKGAVTTVSENSNGAEVTQKVFAVQDTEGNDIFYIKKDPKILGLFESLGIEIIYKKEE